MLTQLLAELGNYKWWKSHEKQEKIISDVEFQDLFTLCKHLVQYVPTKILQQILIQMFNLTLLNCKHTCYFSIFFRAAIIYLMSLSEKANVNRLLVGYGGSKWHNNFFFMVDFIIFNPIETIFSAASSLHTLNFDSFLVVQLEIIYRTG